MTKQYPKFHNWREKINFYFEDIETPLGRAFDLVAIALIVIVSAVLVIETFDISSAFRQILYIIEAVIIYIFVVEYLLRFWTAQNRIRHSFSLYSLIDLLAILPFFLGAHIEFLRVFRVFRFLRILRFYHTHRIVGHLFTRKEAFLASRLFFTFFTIIFVSAGLLYHIEHSINPQFGNFFDAFYFSFIAMTTVGFGDITPITTAGKMVTILMISAFLVFIPWQIGQLIRRIVKT